MNAYQPLESMNIRVQIVQSDVWILLMLLSKSPDIHFTVVVELGGKNGDAVQHRLNVTLTELATHRAGCVKYERNRSLKGVQFIFSETDRGFFSEAYKARRSGFQFLFQTDTSRLCWQSKLTICGPLLSPLA